MLTGFVRVRHDDRRRLYSIGPRHPDTKVCIYRAIRNPDIRPRRVMNDVDQSVKRLVVSRKLCYTLVCRSENARLKPLTINFEAYMRTIGGDVYLSRPYEA
jgi:hypothetical protein